jgi:hypothetical protein
MFSKLQQVSFTVTQVEFKLSAAVFVLVVSTAV